MPVIGTFNGLPMVSLPASPAPRSIEFTAQDVVAVSTSPFTGQAQIQDWQTSWLEANVTLPPLTHLQAQAWIAFLLQLRGQASVFSLGDPLAKIPQGSASGAPVTSGSQSGYALLTRGWTANAANVLLPGDWLQVGFRLYRNLNPVSADSAGNAALAVWPQIREVPPDGTPLVLRNTTGLFRLSQNARNWSMTEAKVYGLTFACREAL